MIYDFYIFSNIGNCLFHLNLSGKSPKDNQRTLKLMFGMLHTMKSLCKKLSPKPIPISPFFSYVTDNYKLHILETYSGLNFIMITSHEMLDQTHSLKWIYSNLYSPYVLRNPFYEPKKPINSTVFKQKLEEHLLSLSR